MELLVLETGTFLLMDQKQQFSIFCKPGLSENIYITIKKKGEGPGQLYWQADGKFARFLTR